MEEFVRPNSEQLTDLHIYMVPPTLWRQHLQSAISSIIDDTISAGFIRVHPEASIYSVRRELDVQLEYENTDFPIPAEYVFLKSVGRCLTQVKPRQEQTLKVKHFQPPQPGRHPKSLLLTPRSAIRSAYAAEIFILDAELAPNRTTPYSGSSSQSSSVRYNGTPRSDRSEFSGHKPIPPIGHNNNDSTTQTSEATKSHTPQSNDKHHNNLVIRNPSNKATQYSRPPTPYHERQDARNPNAPNFADRFEQIESPEEEEPHVEKHVAFRSPTPTDESGRPLTPSLDNQRTLTPLSASPSNSPAPAPHPSSPHGGQQQGYTEDILPPLSATPPSSPDTTPHNTNHSTPSQQPPRNVQNAQPSPRRKASPQNHKTPRGRDKKSPNHDRLNVSDGGLSPEEQQKLDDLLRHKKKPARRRQKEQQDQAEADRKQAEWEAEQDRERRRQEDDARRQQQLEDDERLRQQDEAEERRRKAGREDSEKEERRRKEEEERRLEEERRKQEEEERRLEKERRKREEERLRQEEEEEEERRRQEEEDDEERRRQEAEAEQDSPLDTSHSRRMTPGGRSLTELKRELERVKQERVEAERHREDLVKKARHLQTKTQQRRNQARDAWKKKYFEEKKKTTPLEDQCNKLRNELEMLHRKIMSQLETSKDPAKRQGDNKPSQQNNLKIQATRLQHDIDDLQRRVENIKMKLTTEMKLRNQAQGELKALRAELTQKKINQTLTHKHHVQQPMAHLSQSPGVMLTPRS